MDGWSLSDDGVTGDEHEQRQKKSVTDVRGKMEERVADMKVLNNARDRK